MTMVAAPSRTRIPIQQVVAGDGCVGCGACAVEDPSITMHLDDRGRYVPTDVGERTTDVCPFGDREPEQDLVASRFAGVPHDDEIGHHAAIYAGHAVSGDHRALGSSGGVATWFLEQLFRRGEVDAVVHVGSTDAGAALSGYRISRSVEELREHRKSRYHPHTMAEVLQEVRAVPGRYAVVGVPCFITAVRLLQRSEPVFAERIVVTVALVCGHLKSARFATWLGWNVGIEPGELAELDYRHKIPGRPANRYAVKARSAAGDERVGLVEQIPQSDWGVGLFKLGACDLCDDVLGETADLTCGDAWLPPRMSDWQGANLLIARSDLATRVLADGVDSGELDVDRWTTTQAAASQSSGLRHRREGLSIRLARRVRDGEWVPTKRVAPDAALLDSPYGRRILTREIIARESHDAFDRAVTAGSLEQFTAEMAPLVARYHGSVANTRLRSAAAALLHRLPARVESLARRASGGRRFT